MFSSLPKTNFKFSATFNLPSANAFNLDQSENLSFGKELKVSIEGKGILYQLNKNPDLTAMRTKFFKNIVGKGENAGNQHFLLFLHCFLSNKRQTIISAKLNLLSANALTLVQFKNMPLGTQLQIMA